MKHLQKNAGYFLQALTAPGSLDRRCEEKTKPCLTSSHHCHDRAGPYELDQHKLGFVDSGWDYVTLRVTRGGKSDAGGRGATAGATTRYRDEFPGAVSAGAVVELH